MFPRFLHPAVVDGFAFGPHPRAVQIFWFSLLLLAQAGLAFLLLTYFLANSTLPRMPPLYNVVTLSFIATLVYLILFYTGEYMSTDPPYAQCLVQAVLKHGIDPSFILSSFLLVFETWSGIRQGPIKPSHPRVRQLILLALPYLNGILFAIPAAVTKNHSWDSDFEIRSPEADILFSVQSTTHSCKPHRKHTVAFFRDWRKLRPNVVTYPVALLCLVRQRQAASQRMGVPCMLDLSQIFRITIFNAWILVSLVLNGGVAAGVDAVAGTAFATTFLAVVPLSVCIIFGVRKDILTFWSDTLLRRNRSKELDKGSAQKSGSRSSKSVAPKAGDKATTTEVETITLVASTV
ncbi:hypothetical protein SISSUDRAFT_1061367 [Sistotremastrum suecicum HHB10207 ss-3]|uniref:Uncharacterized protein n=1 Tax=Sistotremastrum suecicum HHB10207 ss-3 TaxID=1314776 RepID=A0A166E4C8_9AGAM|nr:hypothetical protein SISSUDRAFT_1061367 [Sistotremastrum suecicum HHB10207 ss-3]